MLLKYLPISNLNVTDDSYRVTFAPKMDELERSIRAVGIIQPITVRHTPEGTYQVVSGYKRVLAMQNLARQTMPTLVHEAADLSPTQAFLWNVHENCLTRKLNLIEKAHTVIKLQQFLSIPEEELVRQFLPLMGENPSYKILHQLLSLGALTEPMKNHVVTNDLALSSASRIAEFTAATQQELLAVLSHIKPSTNKLNELLALIREISARDGLTVEEILSHYQLLQVVADPNASAADKVRALRQSLRGIRLPQITARQKQLAGLIDGLELPDTAKVTTDPYFENDKIKLEYQFSQPEELTELVKHLQEAFEKQKWQRIFDWYRS
jgi:ParB/RepB/Spo0J family partition protein